MQHEEDSLGLNEPQMGGEDQQIQDSLVQQDHDMNNNNREDDRERERNDDSQGQQHHQQHQQQEAPSGPRGPITTSTVDYSYKQRNGPKQDVAPSNVLGVFGLSVRTSEKDIEDAFSEIGHVEKVVILYDGQTGRSRGFGFVTMADLPEAEACIAKLSGMVKLHGRQLRVDFSNTATPHGKTPGEYRGPRRDAYANRGPNYNAQQGGYEGRSGYQGGGGDRGGNRSYQPGYGQSGGYQSQSGGGDYRSSRDGGRDSRDSRDSRGGEGGERYSSSSSRDPYASSSSRRRDDRDDYRGSSSRGGGDDYRSSSHRSDPRDSRDHGSSSRRERSRSPERRRRDSRSPPRGGEAKEETGASKW